MQTIQITHTEAAATLVAEGLISLAEATRLVPRRRGGRKVSASTIWRWVVHGHGPAGVKLEATRTPGGWVTTAAAMQRFFDRLKVADLDEAAELAARAPTMPTAAAGRASAELDRLGIGGPRKARTAK